MRGPFVGRSRCKSNRQKHYRTPYKSPPKHKISYFEDEHNTRIKTYQKSHFAVNFHLLANWPGFWPKTFIYYFFCKNFLRKNLAKWAESPQTVGAQGFAPAHFSNQKWADGRKSGQKMKVYFVFSTLLSSFSSKFSSFLSN